MVRSPSSVEVRLRDGRLGLYLPPPFARRNRAGLEIPLGARAEFSRAFHPRGWNFAGRSRPPPPPADSCKRLTP